VSRYIRRSLFGLVLLALLVSGSRCAPNGRGPEVDEQVRARQTVADLTALLKHKVFVDSDQRRVGDYVQERLDSGNLQGLAAMINTPGPWHNALWYRQVCRHFARSFCEDRPIAPKGAEDALRALNSILASEAEHYRDTVVYAARAVRFENPKEAKRVLLREYARGSVICDDPSGLYNAPGPCGATLRQMGVFVPCEIVYALEVAEALNRRHIPFPHSDELGLLDEKTLSRMQRAATRFNEMIRADLDRGEMDRLAATVGRRDQEIAEIYAAVLKEPEERKPKDADTNQGCLFGPPSVPDKP